MKIIKHIYLVLLVVYSLQLVVTSCSPIDLYEKSVAIPGHAWKSSYKPSFSFTIKDTSSPYQLFLVLRHNDKYNYNNIYINLGIQLPGSDSIRIIRKDLTLATNEKGWLGNGMDDIYEHRIKFGEPEFFKAGNYTFTIQQIMREDPLENVFNVGLRLEKK
ncbi:MAG: gliding motility lipoprotein GldH [Chitinophagaceae bacterium]